MYNEIRRNCDIFAENREIIRSRYKLDSSMMSLAYAEIDLKGEIERLSTCEDILRETLPRESVFREEIRIPLICNMAKSDNPEGFLKKAEMLYGLMNRGRKSDCVYRAIASVFTAGRIDTEDCSQVAARTLEGYESLKKVRRFSTSESSIPLAAMLAISCRDKDRLKLETDACYEILRRTFKSGGSRQALALIIALCGGDVILSCRRAEDIFEGLRENRHRFGTGIEAATLGILASLDGDTDDFVDEIIMADEYLKTEKGFGTFAVSAETRRMYAAIMVIRTRMEREDKGRESFIDSAIEILMIMMVTHMIADVATSTICD